jgi:hypothetical protein
MPFPRHIKISVARSNDDGAASATAVVAGVGNVLYFRWLGKFSRFGIRNIITWSVKNGLMQF